MRTLIRTLIYSKLDPASGNATLTARLAEFLRPSGEVILRPIPPAVPGDPASSEHEVKALQQLAREAAIDCAIGIHCSRAGTILRSAFAPEATATGQTIHLPYLLIASGTDINVDLAPHGNSAGHHRDSASAQKISLNATLRDAIRHAAAVVSLSPDIFDQVEKILDHESSATPRPRHALIPQAPDIATDSHYSLRAALGLSAEQALILLPAGIRPVKGIAFAIEAAAQALLDHPEHVLVILGPPLDPDYHALCASLIVEWRLRHRGLKGRLHLLAGLPRPDYLAALREAALLLNTSESEAISNAVLEALGAGVPVLARNIAGNRAVIRHNENGLIFEGLPAFLREYRRLFADPVLRDKLVTAGRATYLQQCDVTAEKNAYLALIADVLGQP